tara:strand:- start:288 stop:752 length:465 start_codon:yes stop_codon:yes gene_type:complete
MEKKQYKILRFLLITLGLNFGIYLTYDPGYLLIFFDNKPPVEFYLPIVLLKMLGIHAALALLVFFASRMFYSFSLLYQLLVSSILAPVIYAFYTLFGLDRSHNIFHGEPPTWLMFLLILAFIQVQSKDLKEKTFKTYFKVLTNTYEEDSNLDEY